MTAHAAVPTSVPRTVKVFSPVLKALLGAGVPLGPNALVTIRGRSTGLPRTTPLAIIEIDGRRWVWSPWGDVHWARNLRAARRATIEVRGRTEEVTATELTDAERLAWFRDVFGPYVRSIRGGVTFVRVIDQTDPLDPERAAEGRRVFELHPLAQG